MRAGTAVAVLACLLATAWPLTPDPARAAAKTPASPLSLVQEYLRGSQQGIAGIVLDVDGDGPADLVVGAPYASGKETRGALLVYRATSGGFSRRPSALIKAEGNVGWSLVALGDVAGAGRGVFAAGAFSGSGVESSLAGTVSVFKGGAAPLRIALLAGENAMDKFGYALAAGDFNGDGVPDLAVGAPYHSPSGALYQRGAVYVFFGPAFDPAARVKLAATSAYGGFGFSLAAADLNGDGVSDLLLQATGKALAYYGAAGTFAPSAAAPDAVFSSADAGFGRAFATLPDLDGDGCGELAVSADQAAVDGVVDSGRVFVVRGGRGSRVVNVDAAGPDVLARVSGEPEGGRFGTVILALPRAGGVTPDLAVSAIHVDGAPWPATGAIYVVGGAALTGSSSAAAARKIPGDAPNLHLGSFLAPVDGGRRLAAGAPMADAMTGQVRFVDLSAGR